MSQSNLDLTTDKKTGPVECLGQTFESDAVRRAHYTELLREKLKDPEFRKIEGFPIGEDEDILNLSDPPYYTACPNPWLGDFIKAYGRPYNPKEKYHREPFAADVSEGKNHPIYSAHSYHTKVPHRAIMRYILHYTNPGDVVFDGFCGTGMTGVAAQLCGDVKEVRALGYRVDSDGTIYNQEGNVFSKLGARRAVLNDLSPSATFIAYNYNNTVDVDSFETKAKQVLQEVEDECGWMFETVHTDGSVGKINYTVWSDVFTCPECASELVFWDEAVDTDAGKVFDVFKCPKCHIELTKRKVERAWRNNFDSALQIPVKQAKQVPVLINYTVGKKRYEKRADAKDLALINEIDEMNIPYWFPTSRMVEGTETRRNDPAGITHVHHFYTKRNLWVCAMLWNKSQRLGAELKEMVVNMQTRANRQSSLHISNYFKGGGGVCKGHLTGTLYIPSLSPEIPATKVYSDRIKTLKRGYTASGLKMKPCEISTGSAGAIHLPSNSADFLFFDPPFGANLNYSELNWNDEAWLNVFTDSKPEAIENSVQKKGLEDYRVLMTECFSEAYRVLKPGRWLTVEFSNTKSTVWNSIQTALSEAGFVVANVSALDKKIGSFKAVTTTTAVKQDLVISAYKPDGQLELSFKKHGDSLEGVWEFMLSHLKHLPIVKPRAGQLERIAERDPRILYDRMVAFYIGHNTPVPLSSAEFQAALTEKFPERDGMVFLHEQVAEYDKKAAQMEHTGQLAIFVEDEKSAINWLRQFLKDKPSTYQGLHSEFMQQLSATWKKFESRPELALLLEQNFIKYDGTKDVPGQIHGYLSTNFKDLRKKEKDDPALKAKAKDRWYVPDPKNAIDVEAQREKRLLSEFWDYAEQAGVTKRKPGDPNQTALPISEPAKKKAKVKKLKEVRTEAVRAGFMLCNRSKDTATILAVAEILPNNVIEEDEQLQMIVDMAEMRAG